MGPLAVYMVLWESPQWVWVQGGEIFEIFRPEMQEILIFESFHCWKFSKSNKNQKF
jgi:hypothetical protein